MNRISNTFQKVRGIDEKILSIFVTAGYPHLESAPELVWQLEESGADLIEIGMPFSDPIADGPTIQHSSKTALENGMNLNLALKQIQTIRQKSEIPIILMGYLNPLLKYGFDRFIKDAAEAGVDGLIIPDLLPEEFQTIDPEFSGSKLGMNFLISPNTPSARIKKIDAVTSDFIYCVSVTGVTGSRSGVSHGLIDFLQSIQSVVTHPLLVGFGISNPEDANEIGRNADGVIVGSALIDLMTKSRGNQDMLRSIGQFVQRLKLALKGD